MPVFDGDLLRSESSVDLHQQLRTFGSSIPVRGLDQQRLAGLVHDRLARPVLDDRDVCCSAEIDGNLECLAKRRAELISDLLRGRFDMRADRVQHHRALLGDYPPDLPFGNVERLGRAIDPGVKRGSLLRTA